MPRRIRLSGIQRQCRHTFQQRSCILGLGLTLTSTSTRQTANVADTCPQKDLTSFSRHHRRKIPSRTLHLILKLEIISHQFHATKSRLRFYCGVNRRRSGIMKSERPLKSARPLNSAKRSSITWQARKPLPQVPARKPLPQVPARKPHPQVPRLSRKTPWRRCTARRRLRHLPHHSTRLTILFADSA